MSNKLQWVRTLWIGLLAADGGLLARFWPVVPDARRMLEHPTAQTAAIGSDRALASLVGSALWLACLWLGLALLAALASAEVGQRVPWVARLADRAAPPLLRRVVAVSVGASLLVGPAHAASASAALATPPVVSASQPPPRTLAPVPWPTSADSPEGGSPDLQVPTPSTQVTGTRPPELSKSDLPNTDRGGSSGAQSVDGRADEQPGSVLVRPGDSLWLIAARRLGPAADDPHIASSWPYWYRANRRVIGSDPNLLEPGQRLVTPTTGGSS